MRKLVRLLAVFRLAFRLIWVHFDCFLTGIYYDAQREEQTNRGSEQQKESETKKKSEQKPLAAQFAEQSDLARALETLYQGK